MSLLNLRVGTVSLVVPRLGDREKGAMLLSLAGTTITNGIFSGRTETDAYVVNKMVISVKGCAITIDHHSELLVPEEYRSMLRLDDIAINLDLVIENNQVRAPSLQASRLDAPPFSGLLQISLISRPLSFLALASKSPFFSHYKYSPSFLVSQNSGRGRNSSPFAHQGAIKRPATLVLILLDEGKRLATLTRGKKSRPGPFLRRTLA